jgi:short subunit dehydrogenase-like uncharacterized protein
MTNEREFDLVLLGATGFTGGLAARYLARHAAAHNDSASTAKPLRFAIAGRSQHKLDKVIAELAPLLGGTLAPATIVADNDELASLRAMCARTRVVITTVGPFNTVGDNVVAACVAEKTHYADITGEPEFVRRMISRHDDEARAAGVKVVPCCGFDCIPHDLGVQHVIEMLGPADSFEVEGFVSANAGISGGTLQSALNAMAQLGSTNEAARALHHDGPTDRDIHGQVRARYDRELGGWALPLPTIDAAVVLRSAHTLRAYGERFRYGQYMLIKRTAAAVGVMGAVGTMALLAQTKPTREWLASKLPAGTGPSEKRRSKSWFECQYVATAKGPQGTRRGKVTVRGGDPGYDETAKMLSQTGLCLAFDQHKLSEYTGVLTPAVALGAVLRERLHREQMTFEFKES